jgi:tRNA (mo5U34)-methyltransferase
LNSDLIKKIDSYSWYQTIHVDENFKIRGCRFCGDPAWPHIKQFLPDDLTGKRILDLGCNAGIYCIRAAFMGANCLGVDNDSWKKEGYFEQALIVKDIFEKKYNRKLNVTYLKEDMEKIVHDPRIGDFDYCFGMASLYYAKDQDALVKGISAKCKNIVARIRDENRIDRLTKLFDKYGYVLKDFMREKMWELVGPPTDDFYMFHYAKK